jgi:hypothetical protein
MMGAHTNHVVGLAIELLRETRARCDRSVAALIDKLEPAASIDPATSSLARAGDAFALSAQQLGALALTAAVEVDPRIGVVLARLQGLPDALRPTAGTLAELCDLDIVDDLGPESALRRHRLIELVGDTPFPFLAARCPAAVWTRLAGLLPTRRAAIVPFDQLVIAAHVARSVEELGAWLGTTGRNGLVVTWGPPGCGRHAIADSIAERAGLRPRRIDAAVLGDLETCAGGERDARWGGECLVIASETSLPHPTTAQWLARAQIPRIWIQSGPPEWLVETAGPTRSLELTPLDVEQRARVWHRALRADGGALDPIALAHRYRFGPGRIERVIDLVRADGVALTTDAIASATRATSRPGISALAQRLPPRSEDDLIVSPPVRRELTLATGWARSHARLYDRWGLGEGTSRARGVTCLFAGPPGTGKTLAAQILAGAVDRDLFRVDLSQAVSKWLGETEKNLARLFDEAQDAGAILFFDEADSLFATRTQVRDANDRYANMETGYLLQRLEIHDGIVVLASNRRQDLDTAFQRRFDVIVEFAAPGPSERLRLWQRHLPDAPRAAADIDPQTLSTLFELSGGQIRNAVLAAIAMTAEQGDGGESLTMPLLVRAGARELLRAGRLVNPAEFGAWAPEVRTALPSGAM